MHLFSLFSSFSFLLLALFVEKENAMTHTSSRSNLRGVSLHGDVPGPVYIPVPDSRFLRAHPSLEAADATFVALTFPFEFDEMEMGTLSPSSIFTPTFSPTAFVTETPSFQPTFAPTSEPGASANSSEEHDMEDWEYWAELPLYIIIPSAVGAVTAIAGLIHVTMTCVRGKKLGASTGTGAGASAGAPVTDVSLGDTLVKLL